ncbi:MAG: hydrogenase nickel incorporation protein HypA [Elusimicrobia bacterium RIFCSPHIGHO2_01_FULL_64_10]|nr:MAG: hydrogenase nickel incorporation protein HypA [Elusimicrobia bacterium RIFCSPHIGHO2_01_FULL_64_10]
MHEMSLIRDLMRKIETVSRGSGSGRVAGVKVRLGALSHLSAGHFREHFQQASRGTAAEGAELEVEVMTDESDPHAQDILLESVRVVEDDS